MQLCSFLLALSYQRSFSLKKLILLLIQEKLFLSQVSLSFTQSCLFFAQFVLDGFQSACIWDWRLPDHLWYAIRLTLKLSSETWLKIWSNQRIPNEVINRAAIVLVLHKHALDYVPKLLRVALWNPVERSFFNFKCQSQLVLCLKWRALRSHLIDETAQWPDVTFLVILLFVDLLWAHVVGRAYVGLRIHWALIEHSCKAKVSQLGIRLSVEKDVAWLQIAVQDALWSCHLYIAVLRLSCLSSVDLGRLLPSMAEVQSRDDLRKDAPNERLFKMLFRSLAAFDQVLQVTALTILHHDVEL